MADIPAKMRAAVLMGPDELVVQEVPVPRPGPGEVLIKVESCAICGSDPKIIAHPWAKQPPFGEFIPGHEYAGTIVALGPTVDEFAIGDRVAVEAHKGCGRCDQCIKGNYTCCLNYGELQKGHRATGFTASGGYAQYTVHHINALYKVPDSISFDEAALVTTAGCTLYGLESVGGFMAGETVVVQGPGPIGLMTVQLAKALGAKTVILTGTRAARLEVGRKLGADLVVQVPQTDAVAFVTEATNGLGADLVVECSGGLEAPQEAVRMVKKAGKILLIGLPKQPVTLDLNAAILKNVSLVGVRGEGRRNCGRALALMAAGKIKAGPLITHRFPIAEVKRALQVFTQREGEAIKVIVKPWA